MISISNIINFLLDKSKLFTSNILHKKTIIKKHEFYCKLKDALNKNFLIISSLCLTMFSLVLMLWITKNGSFPWGSDTWGHLFKAKLLYNEVIKGNFFPLYTELWYNGIQPFRYWAPFPYYILLLFLLLTRGDVFLTYNLFLAFIFILGGFGWLLWGTKTERKFLSFLLSLLWFFLPDNLRVLFSEGNIPRVITTTMIPYLFLSVWDCIEKENKKQIIITATLFFLITLSHAMVAAMSGITITVFAFLYGIENRKIKSSLLIIIAALLGIGVASFWLYPALNGGMMSLDTEAVKNVMKDLTYPISQSLNPFIRFKNIEVYYFGLSLIITAILGFIFGGKKSRAGFITVILIFLGTTKALLSIVQKLPMSQLFWMMRFTPLSMGALFIGLILWRKIKKIFLYILIFLIIIDSSISFKTLCYNVKWPIELQNALDNAVESSHQRIAVLDSSEFGSFPSYYLSYNEKNKKLNQTFGWAWQGAKTSQNIVWINTALEKEWFNFLFDRCLELGADTLIVKKDKVKNIKNFLNIANKIGYQKISETKLSITLKYPVNYNFGTKVHYEGLAIGKYASNIAYIFPNIKIGNSVYLDDYSENELIKFKVIYLSGFRYRNKELAESIVRKLSQKGIKFIIDLTDADCDIYTSRPSFLEVFAQPIVFKQKYPFFIINGEKIKTKDFPNEYSTWKTIYLENLDTVYGYTQFENHYIDFYGTKLNSNIVFIGFNLPFFTMITKDNNFIKIFEEITGLESFQLPRRKIVKIKKIIDNNIIRLESQENNVVTDLANIDAFKIIEGNTYESHNLLVIKNKNVVIKIIYPYIRTGAFISFISLILLTFLIRFLYLNRQKY